MVAPECAGIECNFRHVDHIRGSIGVHAGRRGMGLL